MKNIYCDPATETGIHNIILQNRCGNRLTLLCHENYAELELLYKPNAYRRKEFAARNFSNRDNNTELFIDFRLPEIKPGNILNFDYDPFVTRVYLETNTGATNTLTFVNVADENCFAVAAASPLTLVFKPHKEFVMEDGLLYERFSDRGEEIVSFVMFSSYLDNRFRILDDGSCVLQIVDNDIILMGGEENLYQIRRISTKLKKFSYEELIEYGEKSVKTFTAKSVLKINHSEFQRVVDLNRRIVYSMSDEGGVTFGAINRLYHLIWIRDALMSTSMLALSGNPYLLQKTYPFILNSPSVTKHIDGFEYREYLQMVGTKWGKSEDDGLFYLVYGLYNLYQTTGSDDLLYSQELIPVTNAVDYAIKTLFDEKEQLFGSDTIGETTLRNSPFFGYDAVTGKLDEYRDPQEKHKGSNVVYCYTIYHNINMYNVLRMMEVIIKASPDMDASKAYLYRVLADSLKKGIINRFVNEIGVYSVAYLVLDDGETVWEKEIHNPWEYSWAVSLGPFHTDINVSLNSVKLVYQKWGAGNAYGLCPWNTISRILKEYGMDDDEYKNMLLPEIEDALTYTPKYPMTGSSTEYLGTPEALRGLPFTTGSLIYSLQSLILQPLAMGIAVRASGFVDRVDNFVYRNSRIYAVSTGEGQVVDKILINGAELKGSLQIPESLLYNGKNNIEVLRGSRFEQKRLYSSTTILMNVVLEDNLITYYFNCFSEGELIFENLFSQEGFSLYDSQGNSVEYLLEKIAGTNKSVVRFEGNGVIKAVLSGMFHVEIN